MKKITFLTLTFIISLQLFSQEMQSVNHSTVNTDYLAKSKKQRKAGRILTWTGAAVMCTGILVSMAETTAVAIGAEQPENFGKPSTAVFLSGTALLATGITFLTIAKHNKKKALSMVFINEPSQLLRYNTVMNTPVPSVRLRVQF